MRTAIVARHAAPTVIAISSSSVKEKERGRLCEPFRDLDRGDDDSDRGATGDDDG
jgi:hypothetical protein